MKPGDKQQPSFPIGSAVGNYIATFDDGEVMTGHITDTVGQEDGRVVLFEQRERVCGFYIFDDHVSWTSTRATLAITLLFLGTIVIYQV